jgi:VIT1/CCC1 family predicted Fe2+/Mn2+ transporter
MPNMAAETYEHAEHEHRADTASGILRASVFGVSDGLVSNMALVMGVAGGTQSTDAVVLAGAAGLLAGAFSMAAGEYVSMLTQRESMEQQLELEREHITHFPDEEEGHMVELLAESGLSRKMASEIARRIHENVDRAVDFHALHELGIVPRQLGSPVAAAAASFGSFVIGALVPLLPWLLAEQALVPSVIASCIALLIVGGAVTRITGRHVVLGAVRQLAFGAGAAAITYLLGHLIGSTF